MGCLYENSGLGLNVSVGGWSPPSDSSGTGSFTVGMTGALRIYQAYLLAGKCGVPIAPTLTVALNNGSNTQNLTFSNATRVSQTFFTSFQNNSGNSSVHAIDVTSLISLTATNYTLTVPSQITNVQRYADFALIVVYQDSSLVYTDVQIFINENNIAQNNARTLNFTNTIDNTKPVAMGLFTGYCCNNTNGADRTNVRVNATSLGNIGSTTGNGGCGGSSFINPLGNFRYTNNNFIAGANCSTNQAMSGLDVLSDIKTPVGAGTTSYVLDFNATTSGNTTNNLWGVVTAFAHTNANYEADLCFGGTPTVSNITSSGATVSWCPQGSFTNWTNVIQWRTWQTVPWVQFSSNQVNTNTYSITGLITNTAYEFRIVNIDADGAVLRPSPITRFITA